MTVQLFLLAGICSAIPVFALGVANVDMTFASGGTYFRTQAYDWPDSPDQGTITGADFLFSDGEEHVWKINNDATVILEQAGSGPGGRFFPGTGGNGIVTFTADAGTPGKISARYNTFAAMRIGNSSHGGTVNIRGGISFECGWTFGDGRGSRNLNIIDGEFVVFSDNPTKRLNDIDVTIAPGGSLWIQDGAAIVGDVASFESFASGATLTAIGGTLVFTTNEARTSILGDTAVGTRIEVEATAEPVIRTVGEIALQELPGDNPTEFELTIHNDGSGDPLLVSSASWSGPDADHFTTSTDLSSPLPISAGSSDILEFSFDPAQQGGNFQAILTIASNDPDQAIATVTVSAFVVPAPTKVPMLFVHAHADDESIFGGGVLPYYAQFRDLPVAVLSMVTRDPDGSAPITTAGISRIGELRRAMDVYAGQAPGSGLDLGSEYLTGNIRQVNGGFIDTGCCSVPPDDTWSDSGDGYGWGLSSGAIQLTPGYGNLEQIPDARAAAALVVARQIRRFRPVYSGSFTSDGGIGTLFHDFLEQVDLSGMSSRQVADAGLDQHVSQGNLDVSTIYRNGESFNGHHSEWWTLYRSEVGSDRINPDFTIPGDTTGTLYSGWARGDFLDHVTAFPDTDGDGLADAWERAHFPTGTEQPYPLPRMPTTTATRTSKSSF